jgi:NitT/TauT family transport system ATP-binding protein
MKPLLTVRNLKKTYKAKQKSLLVFKNLSFSVKSKEFLTIIGPSGCGKTTILNILAGLLKPTDGEVLLEDKKVTQPSPKIGVVFQNPTLLPWRTLNQNLSLPLEIKNSPSKKKVNIILKLIGLSEFAHSYPHELSGGMQQLISIGRALISSPQILLLDEPFGFLDALTRQQMNEKLQKICLKEKKTTILVTHSIEEAIFLSNRVIVLSRRPAKILKEIKIPFPYPRSESLLRSPKFSSIYWQIRQSLHDFKTRNLTTSSGAGSSPNFVRLRLRAPMNQVLPKRPFARELKPTPKFLVSDQSAKEN